MFSRYLSSLDSLSHHSAIIDCALEHVKLLPLLGPPQNERSIKLRASENTDITPSFTASSFFLSRKLFPLLSAFLDVRSGSSLVAICKQSSCRTTCFHGKCLEFVEAVDASHVEAVPDEPSFFPVSTLRIKCTPSRDVFLQSISTDLS